MDTIPEHFKIKLDPLPNPSAVVQTGQARFTVLTPRLVRMEWSPVGAFEDRASQAFWFRAQPAPKFSVKPQQSGLVIETEFLRLFYQPAESFSAENLRVELKEMDATWYYGDPDPGNLFGTARTVDGVDGATPLSMGLISRTGWSVVDDSASLVFNEIGWLEPRSAPAGQLDLYFLGYGHDYLGCLRDFNLLSGAVPMIPRFILGNWWSRYWEYSEGELKKLMNDFQSREVPLSVCIIDMDWHITQTGNTSTGWTGYTWNRELFPDPDGMLRFLHEKGLKAALNLHPAEGVHPHEEMHAEMRAAVGGERAESEPVEFDITNPRFVDAYFRIL
ncbi:MAG: alpha-xylosidase, partial [Chloroflexi bacterium]